MSLSQQTAQFRASVVQKNSITYNYHISLQEKNYQGIAQLIFTLMNLNFDEISIDFQGQILQEVIINSIRTKADKRGSQIFFKKPLLQRGKNRISISYENTYDSDLFGCVSYYDKKQQLIYTNFQPYGCNRVFPCFDQPNLKAKIRLTVITPPTWVVTSSQPIQNTQLFVKQLFGSAVNYQHKETYELMDHFVNSIKVDNKVTFFDWSQLIPTYIFCLCAGNYKYLTFDKGSVPMTILSSPSSFPLLEQYSSFIFEITQKVMSFYESYLNQRYPYKKFDQIWVYQLTAKAMQNAAICTYDQMYLIKNPTNTNLYDFAEVIAHELGHHWFGNFVTMEWWDDLWLNQSFANFISQFALQNINPQLYTPLQAPLVNFRDTKTRGYNDDERLTATHSVRGQVNDTNVAWNNFDGIVYGKGAGIMKQLYYMVGHENFSRAITKYFDRFGWSNATISDLLEDIEPFLPAGVDMQSWRISWLETPSLDVIEPVWDSSDISSSAVLTLKHSAFSQQYPILRTHKIKIIFFGNNGAIVQTKEVLVPGQSQTTVSYDGSLKVKAIYINSEDYGFFYNKMDSTSLTFFNQSLLSIKSQVTRALIWHDLNHMVKLGDLTLDSYLFLLLDKGFQDSTMALNKMLTYFMDYLERFVSQEGMLEYTGIIFERLYKELQGSIDNNRVKVLSKHYVNYGVTDAQVLKLVDWLKGEDFSLDRLLTDDILMWQIVKKAFAVSSLTSVDKQQIFGFVELRQYSSAVDNTRIICDAILAQTAQYQQIYNTLKDVKVDLYTKELLVEGWTNKYHYQRYMEKYRQKYFDDIVQVSTVLSFDEFQLFYEGLRPMDREYADQISRYQTVIEQLSVIEGMDAHVNNIRKIVDDLRLNLKNMQINSSSNTVLTEELTIARTGCIIAGTINYNCHLSFTEGTDFYQGLTQINFLLTTIPSILTIDILSNNIINVAINDVIFSSYLVRGQLMMLVSAPLKLGANRIAIYYKNTFNNDLYGCISHTETIAQVSRQYIYTQFEPYGAHRLFPCFDQPDLKATANFNIIVSNSEWKVATQTTWQKNAPYNEQNYINNVPTTNTQLLNQYLVGKSGVYWIYPRTQITPVYAFCVIVGDYVSVTLPTPEQYKDIPMTLYASQSLQQALTNAADFFFEFTKLSLEFYEETLGVNYAYGKYDYAFVPYMPDRAMQNPGLVTMDLGFLRWFSQGEGASLQDFIYLASGIAHECAHQWFGNLVTPRWWNDTWLNESFADFMSFECLTAIQNKVTTKTYPAELPYLLKLASLEDGFIEDQLDSTHALSSKMVNIHQAKNYFDGISYQKGGTVLKQLKNLMLDGVFYPGLTQYIQTYQNTSANLADFIEIMSLYYDRRDITIEMFRDMWLKSASLNVLQASWDPTDDSPTATLIINQSNFSQTFPTLRYHLITVTFFKEDGSNISQSVLVQASTQTTITYDGSQQFVAVLLNSANESFVKCRIDESSLQFFTSDSLQLVTDNLTRLMVWSQLNEMVRDQLMRVDNYYNIVLARMETQEEDIIYQTVFRFLDQATNNFLPNQLASPMREQLFNYFLQALSDLNQSNDDANRIIILKQLLVSFCTTEDQIDTLDLWHKGQLEALNNIQISNSQAWQVVEQVFSSSKIPYNQQTSTYDQQKQKSPGMQAQDALNTCLAIAADDSTMEVLYEIFKESEANFPVKNSIVHGWNNHIHLQILVSKYKAQYFSDLVVLSRSLPQFHFKFFYEMCLPIDEDLQGTIQKLETIQLKGAGMLGHSYNLKKIINQYKLKALQFAFNQ